MNLQKERPLFIKVSLDLIDTLPDFFRKLNRLVGPYVISQEPTDITRGFLRIDFKSNKFTDQRGEQVDLDMVRNTRGSWYFKL